MNSEILDVFKIPIYFCNLDIDNKKIEKYCYKEKQKQKDEIIASNSGGYHSKNLNLKNPIFKKLIIDIEKHANFFFLKLDACVKLNIKNMWFNINGYKDSNIPHMHPETSISGCYYVKVPNNSGDIYFEHPSIDTMGPWTRGGKAWNKWNNVNSCQWKVNSSESKLILFPAWLKHGVNSSKNKDEDRISLAFNLDFDV